MIPVAEDARLANSGVDQDADHLADAIYYWRNVVGSR